MRQLCARIGLTEKNYAPTMSEAMINERPDRNSGTYYARTMRGTFLKT